MIRLAPFVFLSCVLSLAAAAADVRIDDIPLRLPQPTGFWS